MRSILLVDDDLELCKVTRLNLESAGYAVACAGDGVEVAHLLDQQSFDLLLTDLLMPNRDGLELISEVQRKHPSLRIIAMSGGGHMSADMYLKMAKGFHVDGILQKPFKLQQLLSAIRAVEARTVLPGAPCAV